MKEETRLRLFCIRILPVCFLFFSFIPILSAAGCSSKYFKDVRPKNKSTEIPFIPTFSWEAEQQITNLQFELYRAVDFDVETKQALGEPLLRVAAFGPMAQQRVPLWDIADLRTKYQAEGIFLTPGYDTLTPSRDYVWVLRGTAPKESFIEVFRFSTRRDYYRPD